MATQGNGNGDEVARLRRQRAILAEFGVQALRSNNLDHLLQEACAHVAEACSIELVKVLELLPDGEHMLFRAGVNWDDGIVGHTILPAHTGSPGGYALEVGKPVISRDIATEDRFEIPQLLRDHGVQSMVNVLIVGERGPWGVLEIDARERRDFTEDEIAFLQNYANLLAAASERQRMHEELADALDRGRMLQAELQHRGRNLLANIQAVASRTRASSRDLDGFMEAFIARIGAISRAQDLLAPGGGASATLRGLLAQELGALGVEPGPNVVFEGPEVTLPAPAAQALAMGVHELATNATKHGALGRSGGRVEVRWTASETPDGLNVGIVWREHGVEILAGPKQRGMGSDTVERSLPRMLGGSAALHFHPDGVECRISFPLTEPA